VKLTAALVVAVLLNHFKSEIYNQRSFLHKGSNFARTWHILLPHIATWYSQRTASV